MRTGKDAMRRSRGEGETHRRRARPAHGPRHGRRRWLRPGHGWLGVCNPCLGRGNAILQACNVVLHDDNVFLQRCNLVLQSRNLVLHVCNLTLRRCNRVLQRCNLALEPCNLVLQRCNPALERCNLVLQRRNRVLQRYNLVLERRNRVLQRCNLVLPTPHAGLRGGRMADFEPFPLREDGLMALWNSGVLWSSGAVWGPASPPPPPTNRNRNRTKPKHTMRRNSYYPRRFAARPEWHLNYAAKLQQHATTLDLSTDEVDDAVADNLTLAYALGDWINRVREFGPACTAAIERLCSGTGGATFVFTTYSAATPPTLPAGAAPVTAGALDRTFDLVQVIKRKAGYTEDIGLEMGIVGSEDTTLGSNSSGSGNGAAATPRIRVSAVQGAGQENARIKFFKDGHTGIWLECRRNGTWETLGFTDSSPFIDSRPLLVAGQAEVREYRARFWDAGQPNGEWCDVAKVTIAP